MKRYIKEMRNDLVEQYPSIDVEEVDEAVKAFRRGYITRLELLRVFLNAAEKAAYGGRYEEG